MSHALSEPTAARRNTWAAALSHYALPLALITLVGLGVRLYGLTAYGIWFDEGYHIALVRLPTVGAMLDAVLSNPPSDPLYVLLLRGWAWLFETGDLAVRSLSVVLSTATLPAIYALGRVLAGGRVGLVGAALFALSPYAVEFGQEAALYTLAALTATAALAAGWRWRESGHGAFLYVVLGIVAIYSHYVVAAILALFALFALHRAAGPRAVSTRDWLLAHLAILAAWVPWLVALLIHWQGSELPRAMLYHPATGREVLDALIQFTSGTASLQQFTLWLQALGLLAGAVLFGVGLLLGTRGVRLLALVAAIIFLVPAPVSRITGLWLFVPHFMLFLLPALMLVLACALREPERPGTEAAGYEHNAHLAGRGPGGASRVIWWGARGALAVWLVAQLWGLWLFYQYPPHGADGLRQLAATLREGNPDGGDPVLVTPPVLAVTLRQYYPGPLRGLPSDFDLRVVYSRYDPVEWNRRALAALETLTAGHDRFWLVYRPDLDGGGNFLRAVLARYSPTLHERYEYADLYQFSP